MGARLVGIYALLVLVLWPCWAWGRAEGPIISISFDEEELAVTLMDVDPGNADGDTPPHLVKGMKGLGLLLDGVDDCAYLQVDDLEGDVTVAMCVRAGQVAGDAVQYRSVFSSLRNLGVGGTQDTFQIDLGTADGSARYRVYTEAVFSPQGYPIGPLEEGWEHLVVRKVGRSLTTFLDGRVTGTVGLAEGETMTIREVLLGADRGGTRFFAGVVDELWIWERGLDDQEVRGCYDLVASVPAGPPYRVVLLDEMHCGDINERGHILSIGMRLWRDGVITDLGAPPDAAYAIGLAMNDYDHIVGYANKTQLNPPFLWRNGLWTELSGQRGTQGVDVNNHTQVVVWMDPGADYLWEDGIVTTLSFPPTAINDRSQIVGRKTLWQNGEETPLPIQHPDGDLVPSSAMDINNRGVIAAAYGWDAALYEDGNLVVLDSLEALCGRSGRPLKINDHGRTVGTSVTYTSTQQNCEGVHHAVTWEGTTVIDLHPEALVGEGSSSAASINNRGQIVGVVWGTERYAGYEGVLWNPQPSIAWLGVSASGRLGVMFGAAPPTSRTAYALQTGSAPEGPWTDVAEAQLLKLGYDSYEFVAPFDAARETAFWRVIEIADTGGYVDSDGDGTPDEIDGCPRDPRKTEPGICGCGVADADSDGDEVLDCYDDCLLDPLKTEPGACGCGVTDTDSDGDTVPDCDDRCPGYDDRIDENGNGIPDDCELTFDSDDDGTPDWIDGCPLDPLKTEPGACDCGVADTDSDGDAVPDCHDRCPGYDDRIDENSNGIPDDCEPGSMATIPAGAFEMGDTFSEGGAEERPVHTVPVSTVYLDRYEVTKALWAEVHTWAVAHGYSFDNPGGGAGASRPVYAVSWYDVVKWCNARSEKEGLVPCYYMSAAHATVYRTGRVDIANSWVEWAANGYRLPTEAEWEKAARGERLGNRYPWGDTVDGTHANYENSGDPWDNGSTPVGTYAPNGYGLYDMAGNMWEWCWDWYDPGWYARAEASAADPHGPLSGSGRVVRGGCWYRPPVRMRCAHRYQLAPNDSGGDFGFRCARGRS